MDRHNFSDSFREGVASEHDYVLSGNSRILTDLYRIVESHPDLDCVILNAGVQYVMDFSKPHTVDISKIQHEITINYVSMVALTHAFMPFFQRKATTEDVAFI